MLTTEIRICEACGAEFEALATHTGPKRKHEYCSEICRNVLYHRENGGAIRARRAEAAALRPKKRRGRKVHPRGNCPKCGASLEGRPASSVFCSRKCYREYARPDCVCRQCGREFRPKTKERMTFCSRECYQAHLRDVADPDPVRVGVRAYQKTDRGQASLRRGWAMRRARKKGNGRTESIDPKDVFERDGWRCGICGKEVRKGLLFPHPESATLDHIIPLAVGGEHVWQNVQCAHFRCNGSKGARGQDGAFPRLVRSADGGSRVPQGV
jgi:5-methylcytosine-specific restriction endonuclease McrA